ncbi:hypothetical protein NXS19_007380 [Fusarium pseudograminearum]|nr:hypothetical protein NXS19_007380 [Fusarium pseudograminearum]
MARIIAPFLNPSRPGLPGGSISNAEIEDLGRRDLLARGVVVFRTVRSFFLKALGKSKNTIPSMDAATAVSFSAWTVDEGRCSR